jgi:hypothetical protein
VCLFINILHSEAIRNPNFTQNLESWWTAGENASWGFVSIGSVARAETLGVPCARMRVNGSPQAVSLITTTIENLNIGDSVWINFYCNDMSSFGNTILWVGDYFDDSGTSGQKIMTFPTAGYHHLKIICDRLYSKGTEIGMHLVVWPGSATVWLMEAHAGNGLTDIKENYLNKTNLYNFQLNTPYPNPSFSNVLLTYKIPVKDYIRLNIYDNNGKIVKTLTEGMVEVGNYSIIWDRKNTEGFRVTNGTYYCVLETNEGNIAKKAIIIK